MSKGYRKLTEAEIKVLESNGCVCSRWDDVSVCKGFDPAFIKESFFSGTVRIGRTGETVEMECGLVLHSGIYRSRIHNCSFADNVLIENVSLLANYDIQNDAVICNTDLMTVEGPTSFGNGVFIEVANESGSRAIPMFDRMSSHAAYMMAMYRHRPQMMQKLLGMVDKYSKKVTSERAVVGEKCIIRGARLIRNTKFGPGTRVEHADCLENGSINSSLDDPVYIGVGVTAKNFILCQGVSVEDRTILKKCFVGQATRLSNQFSAENCAFFANCGLHHGEACSVFAGPYTVSHHKSTLLISGTYSFFNAGSGSNQSNHMYKLGALHQGVIERGSKTTSDSYILWPARVGAFSLVMGRHYSHGDTRNMPFSYLIESDDKSMLFPGVNLRSIGTIRDSRKWPERDNRKTKDILDFISFNLLTPYTAEKMFNALEIIDRLLEDDSDSAIVAYNGMWVKRSSLTKGKKLYMLAINRYLGNILVHFMRKSGFKSLDDIYKLLEREDGRARGEWIDLAGLLVPKAMAEELLDEIESGKINGLEQIHERLKKLHESFADLEASWIRAAIERLYSKKWHDFTKNDFITFVNTWIESVASLDYMRCSDAAKEFSETMSIGYGIDGDREVQKKDFEATRGTAETHPFTRAILERLEKKRASAAKIIKKLESL
ncbi:hypothetical protein SMSP2_00364 [Limihaloglobus sulfuriphilus]|uniref:DUF4954 domain-containing protein n=1 Tax=Limihaloglobus sulfuriphilus TaxID=1851148 RepID=A0A1Q2MCK0_9BACT|nr:DUF4954 family protein [Limihaloglobus sulfuriphilus]AQQ70027.1 hypothetical protein SMSP2_00364 [Limihaloglobus sulfuriphilus]